MAISAEHRSKFAALQRQYWRLHMNEKFSRGSINPLQTNKKTEPQQTLRNNTIRPPHPYVVKTVSDFTTSRSSATGVNFLGHKLWHPKLMSWVRSEKVCLTKESWLLNGFGPFTIYGWVLQKIGKGAKNLSTTTTTATTTEINKNMNESHVISMTRPRYECDFAC